MSRFFAVIGLLALVLAPSLVLTEEASATTIPDPCFTLVRGSAPPGGPEAIPTGQGTESSPYLIATKKNLVWLSWAASTYNSGTSPTPEVARAASYKQVDDIDMTEGGVCNWLPIGGPYPFFDGNDSFGNFFEVLAFKGVYDGGNYSITGLTRKTLPRGNEPELETDNKNVGPNVGMFGRVEGGTLQKINLVDLHIDVRRDVNGPQLDEVGPVGGLAGEVLAGGIVSHVSVTGKVSMGGTNSDNRVGGLVGNLSGSSVNDSWSTAHVGGRDRVGGLIGNVLASSTITDSWAAGDVTGTQSRVGGLVGVLDGGSSVLTSYASGKVTGGLNSNDYAGGLVGQVAGDSLVSSSFATGDVFGDRRVGGLVGSVSNSAVMYSFAKGDVNGLGRLSSQIGALVGLVDGTGVIRDSYATGSVSAPGAEPSPSEPLSTLGGLAGSLRGNVTVERAYATGFVTAPPIAPEKTRVGGFVGLSEVSYEDPDPILYPISFSFWDIDTSGQASGGFESVRETNLDVTGPEGDPAGVTGLTSPGMRAISTYTTELDQNAWKMVSSWVEFDAPDSVWGICEAGSTVLYNDGYPYLLWEVGSDPCGGSTDPDPAIHDVNDSIVTGPNRTRPTITADDDKAILAATGVNGPVALWVSGVSGLMVVAGLTLLGARRQGSRAWS